MPLDTRIKKVLVIGSGPIVIGQAAEFDYAGTQACRVLREDGIEIVLVNSNPATIMTDKNIADRIYIEPLTLTTIKRIIEKGILSLIFGVHVPSYLFPLAVFRAKIPNNSRQRFLYHSDLNVL